MNTEENNTEQKEKRKILVVDDVPRNIQLVSELISEHGYEVAAALSGEAALDLTDEFEPDLILLDIMMPEMDGYETCEKLKENEKTRDIPVIFLTAKTQPSDIAKGFAAGAVDYITKPFNSAELHARVKTHLQIIDQRNDILKISNEREQLLHILCHDLANPSGALLNMIEMLQNKELEPEELLGLMHSASKNILDTIDVVRDLRALQQGKKRLELQPVNLLKAVEESKSILQKMISNKEIKIDVDIDKSINIMAEPVSLVSSVLNNLLTNAIKFSYFQTKITLSAIVEDNRVKMTISDLGIGIPVEMLEQIFNPMAKTSRPGTNHESGTGFGMPLVKMFIDHYNGEISINSISEEESKEQSGTQVHMIFDKA